MSKTMEIVTMPAASASEFDPGQVRALVTGRAAWAAPASAGSESLQHWAHLPGQIWLAGGEIRWPVRADIAIEDGEFFAREFTTGIYGVGQSLALALDDLRHALVGHRDALVKAERLSPDLEEQLRVLQHHLRDE